MGEGCLVVFLRITHNLCKVIPYHPKHLELGLVQRKLKVDVVSRKEKEKTLGLKQRKKEYITTSANTQ